MTTVLHIVLCVVGYFQALISSDHRSSCFNLKDCVLQSTSGIHITTWQKVSQVAASPRCVACTIMRHKGPCDATTTERRNPLRQHHFLEMFTFLLDAAVVVVLSDWTVPGDGRGAACAD